MSQPQPSPLPASPTESFPYLIDALIGEGAMGLVYRAKDLELDRTVAIKTIRPSVLSDWASDRAAEAGKRFLQEARAAASVTHPGITTIFRVGQEAGVPYIVMEWLEGEPLDLYIERCAPVSESEAARIAREALAALGAAHDAGIVHRDIKPENLILLGDGRVKITDFGIARVRTSLVRTRAGYIVGTPRYAAPEQLSGKEVDGRADLYALGVVLFALVTARAPFEADDIMTLMYDAVHAETPRARSLRPELSPRLDDLIARALAKEPSRRFQSAQEMADALRAIAPSRIDIEAGSPRSCAAGLRALWTSRAPRRSSTSS